MKLRKWLAALLAMVLLAAAAPTASALLYEKEGAFPPGDAVVEARDVELLEQRLGQARRTEKNTFEIIDTISSLSERRSTDYTASSLNAWNGVVHITQADRAILEDFIEAQGLQQASDAQKVAAAMAWIHNNVDYNGVHWGSYVYSAFVQKGGQCNIYNGALAAVLNWLGYEVRLVRGYRASTAGRSAHWWAELVTDGEPLVMESGNRNDGNWFYLANTYGETHGGGRDYVKCGRYVWNDSEYVYLGAAVNLWLGEVQPQTARVHASVTLAEGVLADTVTLLAGADSESLQPVWVENVPLALQNGEGFLAEYDLVETGALQPGESGVYAVEVSAAGRSVRSEEKRVTVPLPPTPAPTEEPALPDTQPGASPSQGPALLPALLAAAAAFAAAWAAVFHFLKKFSTKKQTVEIVKKQVYVAESRRKNRR